MDINSTLCPLCKDGIGHAMDDEHAMRVRNLVSLIRQVIETRCEAAPIEWTVWTDKAKQVIAKAEGK